MSRKVGWVGGWVLGGWVDGTVSVERAMLGALVVLDRYARDVLTEMVIEGVAALDGFGWQARLRYYWEEGTMLVSEQAGRLA